MVLINDKKYACATCIKGHRVSGCTHTDRPLFEVKKKGRPSTQCACCRERRKGQVGGQVHNKCTCEDSKPPIVILPGEAPPSGPDSAVSESTGEDEPLQETRKGQPGSAPTFPNGLKDVHDMAAAAESLTGMGHDTVMLAAERRVANLLNPCHCRTGAKCLCCAPKKDQSAAAPSIRVSTPSSSGTHTPTNMSAGGGITDSFVEMFQSKATTSNTPPELASTHAPLGPTSHQQIFSESSPASSRRGSNASTLGSAHLSSHSVMPHHPAHTSPHVHKTRLYSPYSTNGHSTPRHGRPSTTARTSSALANPSTSTMPPLRIRPLADMSRFLGAVFNNDGSVAESIPRSALGLPGIQAFDAMAENGGVKIESITDTVMDVDAPLSFPTSEDVVIGACTCGDDCDCPGCATHDTSAPESGPSMGACDGIHSHGQEGQQHHRCGTNCKSSFDCGEHLSLPSGIQSIGQLLSLAAASVPQPGQRAARTNNDLDPHDTSVLPPAAQSSADAARSLGLVQLIPLECCNGRCQCPPGKCTCEKECCGCCIRCACAEEADADQPMAEGNDERAVTAKSGSCCGGGKSAEEKAAEGSTTVSPITVTPDTNLQAHRPIPPSSPFLPLTSSNGISPVPSPATGSPLIPAQQQPAAPPALAPHESHLPPAAAPTTSALPQSSTAPASASVVRRASSALSKKSAQSGQPARRSTITATNSGNLSRSASSGKQGSKAQPQHPRPILPKPPAGSGTSKQSAAVQSRGNEDPARMDVDTPDGQLPQPPPISVPTLPTALPLNSDGSAMLDLNNLDDLARDDDLMSFINSISSDVGAFDAFGGQNGPVEEPSSQAQAQETLRQASFPPPPSDGFSDPAAQVYEAFARNYLAPTLSTVRSPAHPDFNIAVPSNTSDEPVNQKFFSFFGPAPTLHEPSSSTQGAASLPKSQRELLETFRNRPTGSDYRYSVLENGVMYDKLGNGSSVPVLDPAPQDVSAASSSSSAARARFAELPAIPHSLKGMSTSFIDIWAKQCPMAVSTEDFIRFVTEKENMEAETASLPSKEAFTAAPNADPYGNLRAAAAVVHGIGGTSGSPPREVGALQEQLQRNAQRLPDKQRDNLIDLSKPLNANDLERIMRALQAQQQRQTADNDPSSDPQPHAGPSQDPDSRGSVSLDPSSSTTTKHAAEQPLLHEFMFDPALARDANGPFGDPEGRPEIGGQFAQGYTWSIENTLPFAGVAGTPAQDGRGQVMRWA